MADLHRYVSSRFESPDVCTVFVNRGAVLTNPILLDVDVIFCTSVDTSEDLALVVFTITVSLVLPSNGFLGVFAGDFSTVIFAAGSFFGDPLPLGCTLTGIKLLLARSFVILEAVVVVLVTMLA
uniref:(northern house mosquito) hypothetical protein n=1 Tax=Culex pipiens TaxID=7175 RepID=A0A8D8ALA8_CULPI